MLAKLQRQLEVFIASDKVLKQKYTLEILEWVRGYNEYLHDLYEYVGSGNATEWEYQHIYTAALETQ